MSDSPLARKSARLARMGKPTGMCDCAVGVSPRVAATAATPTPGGPLESASSSSATSTRRTYSTPTRDANDGASNRVYLPSGVREATQPEVSSAVSSSPNLGGRAGQVVHPILAGTPVAALHSPAPKMGVTLHACDRTECADEGKPQATIASPGRASLLPGALCDLPSHGTLPLGDLHLSGHRSSSTSPSRRTFHRLLALAHLVWGTRPRLLLLLHGLHGTSMAMAMARLPTSGERLATLPTCSSL